MGFGTLTVTNGGVALQAKVLGGAALVFTMAKSGSGELAVGQEPQEMTALVSAKQDISISSVTPTVPKQLTVRIDFDNRDLVTGYQWREIGLFAQDPDAGEILYAYCNAGDEGTYMPAGADGFAEQIVDLITVISNVQEITVQLDNTGVTPVWDDLRINGIIPCVGTGTNTIAVNNANITGYIDGMKIALDMGISGNTGATTININGMGAKPAKKQTASGAIAVLTAGETAGIAIWQFKSSADAFVLLASVAKTANAVMGPVSSIDSRIAAFDGITGKTIKDSGITINDLMAGWIPVAETWTYSSISGVVATASVPSGALSRYKGYGGKVRLKQGGAYKYYSLVGGSDTTLKLAGDKDALLASAPITDIYYTAAEEPLGWPDTFNYLPTIDGGTMTLAGASMTFAFYRVNGKVCEVWGLMEGATAGGTLTNNVEFSAPIPPASLAVTGCGTVTPPGGVSVGGIVGIRTATSKIFIRRYDSGVHGAGNLFLNFNTTYVVA